MIFERNGAEYMRLSVSSGTSSPYLDFTGTGVSAGISSDIMFANTYRTRSDNSNTIFQGCDASGVSANNFEYCRYEYANTQMVYSCVINNTGRNVIGNIVDTTVSDERLKTDIEDYNEECSNRVKYVKLHIFKYKDENYKNSDKYGFIAQELFKELPEDMKGIVREVEDKDSKDKF